MTRLKSLRQRVWPAEQRDIGEAVRDLHGFCQHLTRCVVGQANAAVWAEPFSLSLEEKPQIVMLADARIAGTLDAVEIAALDWKLDVQTSGKYRIKINRCATLEPGKSYDLKFLVVY